jgi:tetratricopeptide (TPR) repeat protein
MGEMKRLLAICLLGMGLLAAHDVRAQFPDILQKQIDRGKKIATGDLEEERTRVDSSDFNYAISVIDNSGMMDIRDAGETVVKTVTSVSSITKSNDEKTSAQRCRDLLDIAEKFYEGRAYPAAEAAFITAQQSYESEGLTGEINYSKVHADLGLLYATMGRFNAAEKSTLEAMTLRENTLGKNSKAYASSLNNAGVLMQELARYQESESYFDQALKTIENRLGTGSQEYAVALNNQAILFSEIGRYDAAIENLKKASAIVDKLKKKDLRNQVGFKSNLALLYQQTGKLADAEAIYLGLEKALGSSNPYYAGVLNNLALLYIQMGKLEKVEGYLQNAANVYKARFGDQNHNYAKALNDLGNFYRMQGRLDDAEKNLQQALTIRSTALGDSHPDYVRSQEDLGILYWKKGDLAKANEFYSAAMGKSMDFINRYFPPMSEAEKTKYWDVLQPRFQRYYNYCLDASTANPVLLQTLFEYQMATKGLLLNSTNKVKQAILISGDEALVQDYLAWLDKKEALARYYSLSKEELANQKVDLAALERDANDREKALSARSTEFSKGYSVERVDMKTIAALIGDTEAVVDVIRLRKFDKDLTAEPRYAMVVLTKGAAPKVVLLDNGKDLETRFAKFYKNAILQRIPDEFSYIQFWSKLDPLLAGKKTIYFSPDGVYAQLNVNTIRKTGGDYIGNVYNVVIVGNTRDLADIKVKRPPAPKTAFLLGFPEFGGAAPALPGTKAEIDAVGGVLKTSGYSVNLVFGGEANETNIKALKGPSLVHIATHGYFLPDSESDAMGVSAEHAKNNPLLRSGLILAGAPDPTKEEKRADLSGSNNGVLTAYEAMNLNLEGTTLLVLSACETGLGEVRAGEGVYGLQRAFQVAGARTLLMSLWKVDDAATQLLMTSFYTTWTKTGNKLTAFKQAQAQLRANPKYKDPYYWGAFVMLGL